MKDTLTDKVDSINKVFHEFQSWQTERSGKHPQSGMPEDGQSQSQGRSQSQKPEPDFRCACNGKVCDGICRTESGHFKGGAAEDGGCTAAFRPPKPKAVRRSRL